MLLILDTETTGLSPGQICQLSYAMLGRETIARNYYFAVDNMPATAQAVHGLSQEDLAELSGGRTFADDAAQILKDLKSADVVAAHNLDFDMRFVKAELARCSMPYRTRHGLCTMYYFTKSMSLPGGRGGQPKPPSLRELMRFLDVSPEEAAQWAKDAFGAAGNAHDARYDVAATVLCVERAIERGLMRNLIKERNMATDGGTVEI